nr:MAG TPA: hypothetical protein [Bacteriophage sp.]
MMDFSNVLFSEQDGEIEFNSFTVRAAFDHFGN